MKKADVLVNVGTLLLDLGFLPVCGFDVALRTGCGERIVLSARTAGASESTSTETLMPIGAVSWTVMQVYLNIQICFY